MGVVLLAAPTGRGQGYYPTPAPDELNRLARELSGAVRHLGDEIDEDLGQAPGGRYLLADARELAQAADEFHAAVDRTRDSYQLRRAFTGIDASWHRLRGQLPAPGATTQGVLNAAQGVEQVDVQIHRVLGLNDVHHEFYGNGPPPAGQADLNRLAYTLAQRADALASVLQTNFAGTPGVDQVIRNAADLAGSADRLHDVLQDPAQGPDAARTIFSNMIPMADNLGISLDAAGITPRIRNYWDSYTAVHNQVRANLGLVSQPVPNQPVNPPPPQPLYSPANDPAQVSAWAQQLDREVDSLVDNFGRVAQNVPEGNLVFDDIRRLRDATRNFQADAARGMNPSQLAYEFRDVDSDWRRLSRRVGRLSEGRDGPLMQHIRQIGQLCEQIHRVLGVPGYPPDYNFPR